MKQYLLSIYQPDGGTPEPARLAGIMRAVAAFEAELRAAGAWVFSGGLHDADMTIVVRPRDGEFQVTDGPYTAGQEHVGGVVVLRAEDLDAALTWARRAATATTLPVEVRPFQRAE